MAEVLFYLPNKWKLNILDKMFIQNHSATWQLDGKSLITSANEVHNKSNLDHSDGKISTFEK